MKKDGGTLRETFIEIVALAIHTTVSVPRVDVDDRELPPYREECEYAAQLFGMVTALNGPIEEIVKAVQAVYPNPDPRCGTQGTDTDGRCVRCGLEPEPDLEDSQAHCPPGFLQSCFDPAALFRAITIEGLGGAKVSETFGEIDVPADECRNCLHDTPHKAHHDPAVNCRECDFSGGRLCTSSRCMVQCEVGPCDCRVRCFGGRRLEVPRLTIEGAQS